MGSLLHSCAKVRGGNALFPNDFGGDLFNFFGGTTLSACKWPGGLRFISCLGDLLVFCLMLLMNKMNE